MKPPEVGARNCDWSYESLVCQRTNFIELKVSAISHERRPRRRLGTLVYWFCRRIHHLHSHYHVSKMISFMTSFQRAIHDDNHVEMF